MVGFSYISMYRRVWFSFSCSWTEQYNWINAKPWDVIPDTLSINQDSGAGSGEDVPGLSSGSSDTSDGGDIEHEVLQERLTQQAQECERQLEQELR